MIAAIFLVVMGTIDSPIDTAIGVGITLTGVPVYFLFVYPERLPMWLDKIQGKVIVHCGPLKNIVTVHCLWFCQFHVKQQLGNLV